MNNNFSYEKYQEKLNNKVLDKKQKSLISLQQEFLNYLEIVESTKGKIKENKDRNFTNFFKAVLKEIVYSSFKDELNENFLNKLKDFKKNSSDVYKNKKIKSIILLCDKKVERFEEGIQDLINHTTHELKCNLYIRSLKKQDQSLMLNEIVYDKDKKLFKNFIQNVLDKFNLNDFYESYKDVLKIDLDQLKYHWNNFVNSKVKQSFENYQKAFEMNVNIEIVQKIKSIFSLIQNNSLLIIYNNSEENDLRNNYLFNIENELIKNILENKNVLVLSVSKNDIFKNTFLELSSYANLESLSNLIYLEDIKKNEISIDENEKDIFNKELINSGIKINKYFIDENYNNDLDLQNPLKEKECNLVVDDKKSKFNLEETLEFFVNESEIKNKKSEKVFNKFISEFSKFKKNYSRLKFIDENYTEHKDFSNMLSMLDIEGTTKFIQKNWNDLKLLLRNNNLDKSSILRCYILYLHVLKMLNKINKL